jgi:hypothetical protein
VCGERASRIDTGPGFTPGELVARLASFVAAGDGGAMAVR